MSQEHIKKSYPITGMSCAMCASSVESMLNSVEGVNEARVNLASNSVWIDYDPSVKVEDMQHAIEEIGYGMVVEDNAEEAYREYQGEAYKKARRRTLGAAILTVPVFILGMFFMEWRSGWYISMLLSLPVLFYYGGHFYVTAWKQLKLGKANMDTLVSLSTGISFAFSVWNTLQPEFWSNQGIEPHVYYEAATVIITFISLGKLLEEKAKSNTSTSIQKLMGLRPKTCRVEKNGSFHEVSIDSVMVNDIIEVRPGEQIPVDGVVKDGSSYVDESLITGEPMPVLKELGKQVYAGTINQKGSLRFKAEQVGNETLLGRIIRMVQEAQGSKAPVQKLVDRIAGVFVPTVIVIAVLTFLVWYFAGGEHAVSHALLTSVAVLVISCPCALGLATPTAIMVGIGKGAENHILIKDAESLEVAHRVNAIVLDKTGTITEGKPSVVEYRWLKDEVDEVKGIVLAAELRSEHPLATAIVKDMRVRGIPEIEISDFESITGEGVRVNYNGKPYAIGNKRLMERSNIEMNKIYRDQIGEWEDQGRSVVCVAGDGQVYGLIAIADQVKESSKQAIRRFAEEGIEVHMLTGDSENTASAVARGLGIAHYRGGILPADKGLYIEKLQQEGKVVAMVGDGINDSGALAKADVSVAMGHGSDIAMDVAKITLMTSDLSLIPKALVLSRKTVRGIRQNLFWAFIYNVIGIPIAAGVLYHMNGFLLDPMIAGAAMAFSSVSVVMNSLRLKRVDL